VVFKRNNNIKETATKEAIFNESMFEKLKSKPLLCSHVIAIGMPSDITLVSRRKPMEEKVTWVTG